ncbi:MAG: hypothetical protein M1550_05905, partial [Deltaproteobacteria bacterium]|nr:hypothetical protein [Deltaproteobacteria bacterium]
PFPIGMATGYSGVEIGYGEYIGYHHDSKKLFGSASSNIGTAVIRNIISPLFSPAVIKMR